MTPELLATAHLALRISDMTYESVMATSYGTDDDWGQYMRASMAAAEVTSVGLARLRTVNAWPDCWDHLAVFLREHSHHPVTATQDTRRLARQWAHLALRIEREIAKLANHPAYRNKAILGVDRTILWAWKVGVRDDRYYPTIGRAISSTRAVRMYTHGLLVPGVTIISARSVTGWKFVATNDQTVSDSQEATPSPRAE